MACVEFIALLYKQLVLMDIEVLYLLRTRALWLIPSLNPDTYDNNLKVTTPNSPQVFGLNRKNQRYTCNPKEKKMLLHSTSLIHRRYDENGVDLNRNFPVCFDVDEKGSSSRGCNEDYRVFLSILCQCRGPLHYQSLKLKPLILL